MEKALQNPVWYSLQETHKHWQQNLHGVHFYQSNICAFGAFNTPIDTTPALVEMTKQADDFYIVSNQEVHFDSNKINLIKHNYGIQMSLNTLADIEITEEIVHLGEEHIDAIFNLIWKVMPGFYLKGSYAMGHYYGIFKDGELVALSGQRLQANSFIEISGVVTHPNYTKQGLATQLIVHDAKEIIKVGKHPILHTKENNPAIKLYERLGFEYTRKMDWWYFGKK